MVIAVPKEILPGENRVACVPDVASKLIKEGFEVRVENNAGLSAGYTNEMKDFLESNPGLKSRFTNVFNFEDYTPRQLLEIAHNIAQESGYTLDEGALQIFLNVFEDLYSKRDNKFGNARTARNILYKAISIQEERISSMYDYKDADLTTILYEDVADIKLEEI